MLEGHEKFMVHNWDEWKAWSPLQKKGAQVKNLSESLCEMGYWKRECSLLLG